MNFPEYVEAVSGRKLTNYQKEILEKYEKFPRGAVVLITPRGPVIASPDLKENTKKARKQSLTGYSIKQVMIDETLRESKEVRDGKSNSYT